MVITNQKLLEHFDDEVREKLRLQQQQSKAALDRFERLLMLTTRHELRGTPHLPTTTPASNSSTIPLA